MHGIYATMPKETDINFCITIEPPLCIIDIGNGCEAFSSTICVPAKLELTTTMQSLTRSQFFLDYNFKYSKISSFVAFHEMSFAQLTPEEIVELQAKMDTLEPMNMALFNQKLMLIKENYPMTLPSWAILGGQVISGTFILTEISLTAWFCLKHRKSMGTLLKLGLSLTKKIRQDPKLSVWYNRLKVWFPISSLWSHHHVHHLVPLNMLLLPLRQPIKNML